MPLLNFEIIKPKITFQLDVLPNCTFFQLSELVFIHFNIDKTIFSDEKSTKLAFIYKCVSCRYERTIESYQIGTQEKIFICLPKPLSNLFLNAANANIQARSVSDTTFNDSYSAGSTNQLTNNPQKNINFNPLDQPAGYSSNSNHLMVLNYVDKNSLMQLKNYGYNEIDAAYALAYKGLIGPALDFLDTGLSSDPQVKKLIEQFVSLTISNQTDKALYYKLEVVKMESQKKGENVDINVAANIGLYSYSPGIKSPSFQSKIMAYITQVKQKYPYEVAEKTNILFHEYQVRSPSNSNVNPLEQQMQMFLQTQGQQGQLQNIMNNYNGIQQAKDKFWNIFNSLPSMSPQNYKNPFIETADEAMKLNHASTDDFFYSYGKKLNYDQLMFLYRMFKEKNIEISISMQYLSASNGNIQDAEALIAAN